MAVDYSTSIIDAQGPERTEHLQDVFSLLYNVENMVGLDEPTRIALIGAIKALVKISAASERTYPRVAESLARNSLLASPGYTLERNSKVISLGEKQQQGAAPANESFNDDVRKWFDKFFNGLDLGRCTRISSQLGAWPQGRASQLSVASELFSRARNGKAQASVGFLRFPTREQPTFKLYKIDIGAWSSTRTVEGATEREWGVSCETRSQVFAPQLQVIGKLKPETREKALQAADAFVQEAAEA